MFKARSDVQSKCIPFGDSFLFVGDTGTVGGYRGLVVKGFVQCDENILVVFDFDGQYEEVSLDLIENHSKVSPWRAVSENLPIVTILLDFNIDDFGKAKRGKWSPITAFYYSCLNFKRTDRFGRGRASLFVAANGYKADLNDILEAWQDQIKACQGIRCYSPFFKSNVFVEVIPYLFCGDNAMASKMCHHSGASAQCYCRFCDSKTPNAIGIHMLTTGAPRKWSDVISLVSQTDTTDAKAYSLKRMHSHDNLFRISMIHSCPLDALHNFWLGTTKHFWGQLLVGCSNTQKTKIVAFYNSFNWKSFGERLTGNPVKHFGSYQGKDFKLLAQTMPYALEFAQVEEESCSLAWRLCDFLKVAYKTSVSMQEVANLKGQAAALIEDLTSAYEELASRSKTHHLMHCWESIQRFGSMRNYDTSRYETLNKITRNYILSSNNWNDSRAALKGYAHYKFSNHLLHSGTWIKTTNEESNSPTMSGFDSSDKIRARSIPCRV
jgi:hypothetical protein